MSDLRQALEWIEKARPACHLHVWTAIAAARRFLALTETGPDYEAAGRALLGDFKAFSDSDDYRHYEHWDDLTDDERDEWIGRAQAAVDAALADYLTEESYEDD